MTEQEFLDGIAKCMWIGPVEFTDNAGKTMRLVKYGHNWFVDGGFSTLRTTHEAYCLTAEHVRRMLAEKNFHPANGWVENFDMAIRFDDYPAAILTTAQAVEREEKK